MTERLMIMDNLQTLKYKYSGRYTGLNELKPDTCNKSAEITKLCLFFSPTRRLQSQSHKMQRVRLSYI